MAISFNSGDALAGNVRAIFAVEPSTNTIVELKNNLAITKHADVRLPNSSTSPSSSAPYGASFRTLGGGTGNLDGQAATVNTDYRGVTFAPISVSLADPVSLFIAWNSKQGVGGNRTVGFGADFDPAAGPIDQLRFLGSSARTQSLGTGAHSVLITRTGDGNGTTKIYVDGVIDPAFSDVIPTSGTFTASYYQMGGDVGQGWASVDRFVEVMFDNVVSSTDAARLHNSLTGNGAFALLSGTGTVADTTAPTLTGSITASAITTNSYTLSWPAGADNVAVTGYEYSLNGGTSYTGVGNVLTVGITGRTPGATDQVRVRAFDAAGNRSTPVLSAAVTLQAAAASATVTTPPLKNNTATVQASVTGLTVHAIRASTGAFVVTKTAQATNASGVLAVSDAALTAGVGYHLAIVNPTTGAVGITNSITAV